MRRFKTTLSYVVVFSILLACSPAFARQSRAQKSRRPARLVSAPASKTYQREYLTGDRVVPINVMAQSITIPIGLAQHALAVIEFPANDPFYAQHPGDEKFVTIDKRSRRPTTDPLVLRPGKSFVVRKGKPVPASVITVQTLSGLICSFVVYPVESASENLNSVAVTYDRDAVIAARRKMGLRTELAPQAALLQNTATNADVAQTPSTDATAAAEIRVAATQPRPAPTPAATPVPTPAATPAPAVASAKPAVVPVRFLNLSGDAPTATPLLLPLSPRPSTSGAPRVTTDDAASPPPLPKTRPMPSATPAPTPTGERPRLVADDVQSGAGELERATRDEMNRVSSSAAKLRFSNSLYGLALAVGRSRFVVAGYRIEVVAVRNTLAEPIRLVPGQPEIFVETFSDEGLENSERVEPQAVASTLGTDRLLAPGATYFFAFAFEEPILGARDQLRVAVAQMNAADKPATASLVTTAR